MQRCVGDLFGKYDGLAALVIGGGPSAHNELPWLTSIDFRPYVVLSANEHGCRQQYYDVDFIVHADKRHCGLNVPMKDYLGAFHVPLIGRYAFDDVRTPDLKLDTNSGVLAVRIAAILGCAPIVVTGVECWRTGRQYFHDPDIVGRPLEPIKRPQTRAPSHAALWQSEQLKADCPNAAIRPISGPMTSLWPHFDPQERPPAGPLCKYRADLQRRGWQYYAATRHFALGSYEYMDDGQRIVMTATEAADHVGRGELKPLALDTQ